MQKRSLVVMVKCNHKEHSEAIFGLYTPVTDQHTNCKQRKLTRIQEPPNNNNYKQIEKKQNEQMDDWCYKNEMPTNFSGCARIF